MPSPFTECSKNSAIWSVSLVSREVAKTNSPSVSTKFSRSSCRRRERGSRTRDWRADGGEGTSGRKVRERVPETEAGGPRGTGRDGKPREGGTTPTRGLWGREDQAGHSGPGGLRSQEPETGSQAPLELGWSLVTETASLLNTR